MARLRGAGLGTGTVLGTAAVIRVRGGIPLMPEPPADIAERLALHRLTEKPEVILVADDYRTALVIAGALPWGTVTGIVAAYADADSPVPAVPAVVNVKDLMAQVDNGMLVLVDATRGVILADPDGMAVAHYQAEHDRIAPRRRLFLESVHLPARTLDGRTIQVAARVETPADITTALEEGADALYVPFQASLLPDSDDDRQRRNLFRLADLGAGKPLILSDDYALASTAVLEAADRADITLAVPPREDLAGLGMEEISVEWMETQADCFENDVLCALPRLAVDLVSLPAHLSLEQEAGWVEALAGFGATRLVLNLEHEIADVSLLARLETLIAAASANLMQVTAAVALHGFALFEENDPEDSSEMAVPLLVGTGLTGLIVRPSVVTATKTRVNGLNFSECRESLLQLLSR